jgi:hypothetical protein
MEAPFAPPGPAKEVAPVNAFGPHRLARSGGARRLRGVAHFIIERARDTYWRRNVPPITAVGAASLVALIGILAVLDASRTTPGEAGGYGNNAEVGDAGVPFFATEPGPAAQIGSDPTKAAPEPDSRPSPISVVFPFVGDLIARGADGSASAVDPPPFSDPQPAPSPSPSLSPSPSPDTSPAPTPTPSPDEPSPTPSPSPSAEPSPEPSAEPTPSVEPEPSPSPSEEPSPSSEPSPTSEPSPEPGPEP